MKKMSKALTDVIKYVRIGIVASTFQKEVTDNLEKHCVATLKEKGVLEKNLTVVHVPGSLEIPLILKKLAKLKKYDALIALGAIHKGQTYHFEQIANECIRGCMDISWHYEIPVIYEVLAVYQIKDAIERATRKKENRGVEAALTALEMVRIISTIEGKKNT